MLIKLVNPKKNVYKHFRHDNLSPNYFRAVLEFTTRTSPRNIIRFTRLKGIYDVRVNIDNIF
ncbi:hypothetical protein HanRHA438_Chr17g0827961 [Helianthus annuus]|nr:hypothetical protein HanRHA438_Chr17g0827961 [Helianthus annuus]